MRKQPFIPLSATDEHLKNSKLKDVNVKNCSRNISFADLQIHIFLETAIQKSYNFWQFIDEKSANKVWAKFPMPIFLAVLCILLLIHAFLRFWGLKWNAMTPMKILSPIAVRYALDFLLFLQDFYLIRIEKDLPTYFQTLYGSKKS